MMNQTLKKTNKSIAFHLLGCVVFFASVSGCGSTWNGETFYQNFYDQELRDSLYVLSELLYHDLERQGYVPGDRISEEQLALHRIEMTRTKHVTFVNDGILYVKTDKSWYSATWVRFNTDNDSSYENVKDFIPLNARLVPWGEDQRVMSVNTRAVTAIWPEDRQ